MAPATQWTLTPSSSLQSPETTHKPLCYSQFQSNKTECWLIATYCCSSSGRRCRGRRWSGAAPTSSTWTWPCRPRSRGCSGCRRRLTEAARSLPSLPRRSIDLPREQHGASWCLHLESQVGVVGCCFASPYSTPGSPKIANWKHKTLIRELVHKKRNSCTNGIYN